MRPCNHRSLAGSVCQQCHQNHDCTQRVCLGAISVQQHFCHDMFTAMVVLAFSSCALGFMEAHANDNHDDSTNNTVL
jgi:hypothetical protein